MSCGCNKKKNTYIESDIENRSVNIYVDIYIDNVNFNTFIFCVVKN